MSTTCRPKQTTSKLGDILSYYSDVEELGDEMQEWFDNMPEGLQGGDKGNQVEEAADTLSNANSDLETGLNGIEEVLKTITNDDGEMSLLDMPIEFTHQVMYGRYNMPRWVRLFNATSAIEAAMTFIEERMESIAKDLTDENVDAITEHKATVDSALEDLQNVEFPTMFG